MSDAHCLALLAMEWMKHTTNEDAAREWALGTMAWAKAQDAELARRVTVLTAAVGVSEANAADTSAASTAPEGK